ncbi:MAG: hypothetical protein HN441_06340 [Candidatus Thioglobus sp.]|jgi:hypothetical protein|nr:MAG: hypothetical protein Sup05_0714 [uncultured Candidatus Thioglobus sp.]MBT3447514.1 hypothetical protein [Candidatus Thioglobus sp.]MBT5290858.1 hypothetical protein [Thiotrichales bacterium]
MDNLKLLSESLIEKLSGSGAYKRGVDYYQHGLIKSLHINPKGKISAEVIGSKIYHVHLHHTSTLFEGHCNCPASDNFDFCKHCVAVALSYYHQIHAGTITSGDDNKIRAYVESLPQSQLVDAMLEMINDNSLLHERWLLKVQLLSETLTPAALKKRITKAIPYKKNLWDYRQVGYYFSEVEMALQQYIPIIEKLPQNQALKLFEYTLSRLNKALEGIDDSVGYRYATEELLTNCFQTIFDKDTWIDKDKGKYLAKTILKQDEAYGFLDLSGHHLEVLNKAARQAFFTQVEKTWETTTRPTNSNDWGVYWPFINVQKLMIKKSQLAGDFHQELSLRALSVFNLNDCLYLSQLCLKQKHLSEALHWQKQAEQYNDKRPHDEDNLLSNQISIWHYQKDYSNIVLSQWHRYQQNYHLPYLQALFDVIERTTLNNNYYQQAQTLLQTELTKTTSAQNLIYYRTKLVELYLYGSQIDQALLACKQGEIEIHTLLEVIDLYSHDARVLPLVEQAVSNQIGQTNNESYKEAIALLKKIKGRLDKKSQSIFEDMVLRLLQNNKQKRNFVAWLKEAFTFISLDQESH